MQTVCEHITTPGVLVIVQGVKKDHILLADALIRGGVHAMELAIDPGRPDSWRATSLACQGKHHYLPFVKPTEIEKTG